MTTIRARVFPTVEITFTPLEYFRLLQFTTPRKSNNKQARSFFSKGGAQSGPYIISAQYSAKEIAPIDAKTFFMTI